MIFDSIENAYKYEMVIAGLSSVIAEAMKADAFVSGKTILDGDDLYVNRMTYETHSVEGAMAEAHRKYADVMLVYSGKETILVGDMASLEVTTEYDPEKDYLLGKMDVSLATKVNLTKGKFLVLFPDEVHAPACFEKNSEAVMKIVGKIKVVK